MSKISAKRYFYDNKMQDIGFHHHNGIQPVKKISTKRGYEYTGTHNHKMQIVRNSKIIWCRTDDLTVGDTILINRTPRWFNPSFDCTDDQAYVLGAMIGDGSWVNKYYIRFTNVDGDIINYVVDEFGKISYSADELHYNIDGKQRRLDWLHFWQLDVSYTVDKKLPDTILCASKSAMSSCLSGLFDTDGGIEVTEAKDGISCTISFYNTSFILIKQIQYILLHFGIMCTITYADKKSPRSGKQAHRCYQLMISGMDTILFNKYIGFRLKRKQEIFDYFISKRKRHGSITNNLVPIDKQTLVDISQKYHNEIDILEKLGDENIYYDDIVSIQDCPDMMTYDVNVPTNNLYCANGFYSHNTGEKIRGLRATTICCEEFNSVPPDIYETVIAGFASVTSTPVENVKLVARRKKLEKLGLLTEENVKLLSNVKGNQSILSGTAGYDFEHFADYWKRYKSIVESRGNKEKLSEIFDGEVPNNFDWKDYSIIRIPYELIPEGFMDMRNITRSKATMDISIFNMEYNAVFVTDSNGFFKRSLIESCVAKDTKPIILGKQEIVFSAVVRGNSDLQYVYGIDPASEKDNFSIIVLELHLDHTRIVYCWTTNRKDFRSRIKAGLVKEHDFYSFCARKVRDLMKFFPCAGVGMDAQGGGVAVEESLHDADKLHVGEVPIWPIIDDNKEKDTDILPGLHKIGRAHV